MVEYRITIGHKPKDAGQPNRRPSGLEMLKAGLLGLLALATIIGVLIAAFIIGSVIASVLLVLLAVALIIWFTRRLLSKLIR
jgi:Flp pilus assembly protein TadB